MLVRLVECLTIGSHLVKKNPDFVKTIRRINISWVNIAYVKISQNGRESVPADWN